MINHFKTLGVSIDAEDFIIRAAWVALLKRHHPDVDPSAEAAVRTRHINEAFATLRHADKRRKHRADLLAWLEAERRKAMPSGDEASKSDRSYRSDMSADGPRHFPARNGPSVFTWLALLIIGYASIQVYSVLSAINDPKRSAGVAEEGATLAQQADHGPSYETVEPYKQHGRTNARTADYPSPEAFHKADPELRTSGK